MRLISIITICIALWSTSALAEGPHARIDALELEVQALQGRVTDLEGRVTDLESGGGGGGSSTLTLQNDSFTAGGQAGFVSPGAFFAGDEYAATLGPVAGTARLQKVQLLFGPDGGSSVIVTVRVYQETGNADPGTELLVPPVQFQISPSSSALQEFDLTPANLILNGGSTVRVSVQFDQDVVDSGPGFDANGLDSPQRNWLKLQNVWQSSGSQGVAGDWILRAVIQPL